MHQLGMKPSIRSAEEFFLCLVLLKTQRELFPQPLLWSQTTGSRIKSQLGVGQQLCDCCSIYLVKNERAKTCKIYFVYLERKRFPIVFSQSNKTYCETSTLLYLSIIVSASQYNITFHELQEFMILSFMITK